jgi:hypothetical protein
MCPVQAVRAPLLADVMAVALGYRSVNREHLVWVP